MSKEIEEVSRRNAEIFNFVVKEQNFKIQEQQKRIDLLSLTISNLTQKITELETMIIIQKVKATGNGPSVK